MNFLLAVLSALLLILTFPRWSLFWLAAVALAPLLAAAARERRPGRRFLIGWTAGIVYWFGVCYWIQFTLAAYAGVGEAGGWALFLLFCLAKGLHMAVFALLAGILMRGWWAVPAVAALWVAVEWSHNFLGFAWLALGNAGITMSVPLRLAPYTGVYGVSFVFAMLNAALALAFLRRPRIQLAWLAALLLIPLVPSLPDAERGRETAVLVQPNIDENEEWTPASAERMKEGLITLSRQAYAVAGGRRPPGIIAWPEMPAPLYFEQDERFREQVADLARSTKTWVLLGVVAFTPSGAPLNSAVLVSPEGGMASRYDKMNLVPFGEFVPWPFGAIAEKVSTEAGTFVPGTRLVVSSAGAHKLGAFICYESVFPHFVRRFAADGAGVLFNLSNDGYFGETAARLQHLDIVRMRAVENRRWILRATNDGLTAAIDPAGRVRGKLPPYLEAAFPTGFNYITAQTFYTRHGDWLPVLCAIGAMLTLGLGVRRREAGDGDKRR